MTKTHFASAVNLLALAAFFSLPCGCSTIKSSSTESYAKIRAKTGLYYFLPKALITVEGKPDANKVFTITISRTLVPDTRQQYFLRWTPNALFDDNLSAIKTDDDGLLTTISIDTTDQSLGILKDLADTTASVFSALSGIPNLREDQSGVKSFKYTFDPLDKSETDAVVAELASPEIGIVLAISPYPATNNGAIGAESKGALPLGKATNIIESSGVFYRPAKTIEFKLSCAKIKLIARQVAAIPNPDNLNSFPVNRTAFVKRQTSLTFNKGMLQEFTLNHPSGIKAFTASLKDITSSIGAALPNIVNVKVNQEIAGDTLDKKMLDARTEALKSQVSYLSALQNAQAANAAASGGNRSAEPATDELKKAFKDSTALRQAQEKEINDLRTELEKLKHANDPKLPQ